jgi:hypothetical protein
MLTKEEIDRLERGIRMSDSDGRDVWPDGVVQLCAMARGMLDTTEIQEKQLQHIKDEVASLQDAMVPASERARVRDLEKMLKRETERKREAETRVREMERWLGKLGPPDLPSYCSVWQGDEDGLEVGVSWQDYDLVCYAWRTSAGLLSRFPDRLRGSEIPKSVAWYLLGWQG